jgi:hypothetical protein
MEKMVSVVIAASGEIKDIALSPGATVREILKEAGLNGYQLSRKGGEPLAPDTDLYAEATDSEKLYATPEDVSVGVGGSASPTTFQKCKMYISDLVNNSGSHRPDQLYRFNGFKKKESGL